MPGERNVRPAVETFFAATCWNPNHPVLGYGKPKSSCVECVTAFVGREVKLAVGKATRDATDKLGALIARRICDRCNNSVAVIGTRGTIGMAQFLHNDDEGIHVCEASFIFELLGRDRDR